MGPGGMYTSFHTGRIRSYSRPKKVNVACAFLIFQFNFFPIPAIKNYNLSFHRSKATPVT